jgi:hypothetical protein
MRETQSAEPAECEDGFIVNDTYVLPPKKRKEFDQILDNLRQGRIKAF